jgi:predicted MFS family arabinose efflux permease
VGAVLKDEVGGPRAEVAGEAPLALAWSMWGLGAALYLIAFSQRVAPAVITTELTRDFDLSAASLGHLSAFYFYGYVAVQIPTGLLADSWGPRRVLTAGAAMMAAGMLLFALAGDVVLADAGRFVVGAAGGVAFVSMLKLASHWMPSRQFAFASGIALLIGTLGATLAGAPLRITVDAFGWRPVMVGSALVTAIVAAAIWIVVRDDPAERGYESHFGHVAAAQAAPGVAAQLREVLRYRNAWLSFAIPGAFSGIILTFAGLWGVPFLVSQHGLSARQAAAACSAMLIAWSLGAIAYGMISERTGRRKAPMAASLVLALALWAVILFAPALSAMSVAALLLALAFAGGGFVLIFAFAKESVPPHLGGTASGIANMGVMLGGMVMQPWVGFMLDRHWGGRMEGGMRVHDLAAYQWGFASIFAWGLLSLALIAIARETHCRPLP